MNIINMRITSNSHRPYTQTYFQKRVKKREYHKTNSEVSKRKDFLEQGEDRSIKLLNIISRVGLQKL